MEAEAALIEFASRFHLRPVLVADAVVYCFEIDFGKILVDWVISDVRSPVAWQKWTSIERSLDECMGRVA